MNPYATLLSQSIIEVEEFSATDEGQKWDHAWYEKIKEMLYGASNCNSHDRAAEMMDAISWAIVDSGPLGQGFAPSFNQAQETLIKFRRHQQIEKHSKSA